MSWDNFANILLQKFLKCQEKDKYVILIKLIQVNENNFIGIESAS